MSSSTTYPRVRVATAEDKEILIKYNSTMAEETEGTCLKQEEICPGVETGVAEPKLGVYFVLEVQEGIVGMVRTYVEWLPLPAKPALWIESVYVCPEHRRKGYFSLLYNRAKEEAIKIGAASIKLYVHRENSTAQATYSSLGMKEIGKMYATTDLV